MATDLKNRRAKVWELGAQGYYDAALEILDSLLKESPDDITSIRMQGNLLELKALDVTEHNRKGLTSSVAYLAARSCYERILEIDPQNARAHIDLGDHYRNLDANDRALGYYQAAVELLQHAPRGNDCGEDAEELLKAVALLKNHERLATAAGLLEEKLKRMIGVVD